MGAVNYTCYNPTTPLLPRGTEALLECDQLDPGYQPQHFCMNSPIHYRSQRKCADSWGPPSNLAKIWRVQICTGSAMASQHRAWCNSDALPSLYSSHSC